jgi:SAM-dependent methyltransferase
MTIPTTTWVLPRPRKDAYVGSFPLHFEKKLWRLLGCPEKVLHPFGGLCEIGDSIDLNETTTPTWVGDAHDLHWIPDESYDLVILDPPYSDDEAAWLYSTPPLKRAVYTREALRVLKPGGHLAVYQITQPATPKGPDRDVPVCELVHRIVVLTRSGHAPRVCFVYEKVRGRAGKAAA